MRRSDALVAMAAMAALGLLGGPGISIAPRSVAKKPAPAPKKDRREFRGPARLNKQYLLKGVRP